MKVKHISILIVALLIADQALKIWVKTTFHLGEALVVIPNWFQLLFVENNGAAFGMQITSAGSFDWGKLALSLFRIILVGGLCYYTFNLARKKAPAGILVGLALIIAGAATNGVTKISSPHWIDRGYTDIERRLRSIGVKIERVFEAD